MDNTPPINVQFDIARDVVAHEKFKLEALNLRQDEIRIETGQMSAENSSRILRVNRDGAHSQHAKDKQSNKDTAFTLLLEQMRQQLDILTQRMDALYGDLENKYGADNVIDGMAQTFLPPEVLSDLKTDEDKLRALADEMLNPDRSIKDKYKHLQEAQYIQAWREEQILRAMMDKYENKGELTLEDKQEIYHAAEASSLAAKAGNIMTAANQEIKTVIDTQVVDDRLENSTSQASSSVTFG